MQWLTTCFGIFIIYFGPVIFPSFTQAQNASYFRVYGSKKGTHEHTKGSTADRIIDIEAIEYVYEQFVQTCKNPWNKPIPDICNNAQGSNPSNAFRIKVRLTAKQKSQIGREFPNVTFAWVLFGRESTPAPLWCGGPIRGWVDAWIAISDVFCPRVRILNGTGYQDEMVMMEVELRNGNSDADMS